MIAGAQQPHVGAVRMTMTPQWSGEATVTDRFDGAGARRVTQTGGGAVKGSATDRRGLPDRDAGKDGAVASTLISRRPAHIDLGR